MALWGKTDALASAPKFLEDAVANTNKSHDLDNAVFVSDEEAAIASNRAKGLTGPGWWLYHQDANGRHHAECLVPMKGGTVDQATVGDAGVTGNTAVEDTIVADE
jgi:hypothetical protein